jgi:site-specific DNA-methyltransferase (adenine-specific)
MIIMQNTLFTNDNLFVLYGMNSEIADLIYLDPPFNSKRMYSAPVGTKAAGASFKDMWTWEDVNDAYLDRLVEKYPDLVSYIKAVKTIHSEAMMAYVMYMAQRLIEMHRVLKSTGSLYLHCDPTASHYLKNVLDAIFGRNNFINNIVWCYNTQGKPKKGFAKKHDDILFYAKDKNKFKFNKVTILPNDVPRYNKIEPETGRAYQIDGKGYKYYLDDGRYCPDYWDIQALNSQAKERTGYPTQKPLALLHRIIKASSNEGDLVLDPFCGCATTCVAAQQLQRKWIGIDVETNAVKVLINRLSDDQGLFSDFINLVTPPQRTDVELASPDSKTIKERLFAEQSGNCNGCGEAFKIWNMEIDHIVPKSKGGGDYVENYQLLCGSCNKIKGDRTMEYLRTKLKIRLELIERKITYGF